MLRGVVLRLANIKRQGYGFGVGQLPKGGSPMQQFLYDLLVGVLAAVIAALVIRRINR